jgi:CRP-like cAMP-binding protein
LDQKTLICAGPPSPGTPNSAKRPPRSAMVVAREDIEVLSLDRDQFHSVAHHRPQIAMEMCKVLAGRLHSAIS